MVRTLYMAAVAALQAMLMLRVVPAVARLLQEQLVLGSVPDGWPAVAQVACAAVCVAGAGLCVSAPAVVLMRHFQRGVQRYRTLPRWTVLLTFCGAALLIAGTVLRSMPGRLTATAATLPHDALPLGATGIALMCAGTLLGEILRRNQPLRVPARNTVPPPVQPHAAQLRRAA